MIIWDTEQSRIRIKHGGQPPGCSTTALFIIGSALLATGAAIYLERIDMSFLDNSLPVAVFSALFGILLWLGAMGSKRHAVESVITIDSFNQKVSYNTSGGGADIAIPFAHLKAVIFHETVTEESDNTSMHAGKSASTQPKTRYTYRIYLLKNDGPIIWLYTFPRKSTALEHVQLLLDRIKISCIDEAQSGLSRTIDNPYQEISLIVPTETSSHLTVTKTGGAAEINLRYERYGLKGMISFIFMFALFVGCPVWFYMENRSIIIEWFLIIPAIPFLAMVILIFMRGRNYTATCNPGHIDITVRFWFPLFQWIFGKTVEIPASVLKAVRVNRYEGDDFHLELVVDKTYSLPRGTKLAFNSGAIRMLPRSVLPGELKPIGLWSIIPISQRGSGPLVSDLQSIEVLIQQIYNLDISTA